MAITGRKMALLSLSANAYRVSTLENEEFTEQIVQTPNRFETGRQSAPAIATFSMVCH